MNQSPAVLFGAAHRPQWLALHEEPALMPELPIIDAHHHFWDRAGDRYLLSDLWADAEDGHHIVATVYMQCWEHFRQQGPLALRPVGETEHVCALARGAEEEGRPGVCAGIVGYADLREPSVQEVLQAHIAAGEGRFKGVRQPAAWDPDPRLVNPRSGASAGLLADAAFRRGFSLLAPLGLRFDAWVFHPQLPEVLALAQAFPETTIVLNHVGGPIGSGRFDGERGAVRTAWLAAMCRIATECPNVVVKLGGLGMPIMALGLAQGDRPLASEVLASSMRPWIEPCIEAFGAARCMFESNFPVDRYSYRYRLCWNAFKRLTAGASAGERELLLHGTAARVYGIASP